MINQDKKIDQEFLKICRSQEKDYPKIFQKINQHIDQNNLFQLKGFEKFFVLTPFFIAQKYFEKLEQDLASFSRFLKRLYKEADLGELQRVLGFSKEEKDLYQFDQKLNLVDPFPLLRFDFAFEGNKMNLMEINTNCPNGHGILEDYGVLYQKFLNFSKLEKNYNLFTPFPDLAIVKKILGSVNQNDNILLLTIKDQRDDFFITESKYFLERYLKPEAPNSFIGNIQDVTFKNNQCYFKDKKIDFVYRLFDLDDLLVDSKREAFIQSYQNRSFKMLNPFVSSLFGEKSLLALIYNGYFDQYFTDKKEGKTIKGLIPPSFIYQGAGYDRVKNGLVKNRQDWILKKSVSSRAEHIHFGEDYNSQEWQDILKKIDTGWLIQKKIQINKYKTLLWREGKLEESFKVADFLPFLVDNKIVGLWSRFSDTLITNFARGGAAANMIFVYEKE